jgi:hypothetical protein
MPHRLRGCAPILDIQEANVLHGGAVEMEDGDYVEGGGGGGGKAVLLLLVVCLVVDDDKVVWLEKTLGQFDIF